MGGGPRFTAADYQSYAAPLKSKSTTQIFKSTSLSPDLDPSTIKFRESCDLNDQTPANPIMLFVDETGSMGHLATEIIKRGLGVIMNEIIDRKPISDPHILIGGVGDAFSDQAPLQVSQFEVSVQPITEQIEKIFIEGNGGGNGGESYILAWYFAAFKTKTDSMLKRNKKGYLFTVGDEPPHLTLTRQQIKKVFGDDAEADYTAKQLLDLASESWEVFHLRVNPDRYPKARWVDLLGERAIDVNDHNALAEVVVSTIQILEGADKATVLQSWSGDKSLVVASSLQNLTVTKGGGSDVVAL